MDYYSRLLKNYSDLIQYLTLNIADPVFLEYKKQDMERLALKTFQIGLLEPHRSYLSNFSLNNIEDCINKCQFHDNRKQEWEFSEFIRRTQEPPRKSSPNYQSQELSNYSNRQPSPQNSFPFHNQQKRFSEPQNSFNFQNLQPSKFSQQQQRTNTENFSTKQYQNNNQGFPNSINKPIPSRNIPLTNKKVFGTKPGSSFTKMKYQPTPMSTSTIVPTQQPPPQRSFEFEELFNVKAQNNNDEYLTEEQYEEYFDEENDTDENFQLTASEPQQT